ERVTEETPQLAGTVTIQIALDTSGAVSATSTIENTTENELLQACVEDGVETLAFPVPEGNAELGVIKIPVHFDPFRAAEPTEEPRFSALGCSESLSSHAPTTPKSVSARCGSSASRLSTPDCLPKSTWASRPSSRSSPMGSGVPLLRAMSAARRSMQRRRQP